MRSLPAFLAVILGIVQAPSKFVDDLESPAGQARRVEVQYCMGGLPWSISLPQR